MYSCQRILLILFRSTKNNKSSMLFATVFKFVTKLTGLQRLYLGGPFAFISRGGNYFEHRLSGNNRNSEAFIWVIFLYSYVQSFDVRWDWKSHLLFMSYLGYIITLRRLQGSNFFIHNFQKWRVQVSTEFEAGKCGLNVIQLLETGLIFQQDGT